MYPVLLSAAWSRSGDPGLFPTQLPGGRELRGVFGGRDRLLRGPCMGRGLLLRGLVHPGVAVVAVQGPEEERPDHVALHGAQVVHLDGHGARKEAEAVLDLGFAELPDRLHEALGSVEVLAKRVLGVAEQHRRDLDVVERERLEHASVLALLVVDVLEALGLHPGRGEHSAPLALVERHRHPQRHLRLHHGPEGAVLAPDHVQGPVVRHREVWHDLDELVLCEELKLRWAELGAVVLEL